MTQCRLYDRAILEIPERSMAKKARMNQVTASYHYLVKRARGEPESEEVGFTRGEFERLVKRLRDTTPIDFKDEAEVLRIKRGENIPLLRFTEISENRFFGKFEGAYYGQEYRNTKLGTIDAESLNLRTFHYLVDFRRDGKIVLGSQYLGNFGDYDGLSSCFSKILQSNTSVVRAKSITSLRHEIGDGTPVELKVSLRKRGAKAGAASLFSKAGVFAVRRSDYGDDFDKDIASIVPQIRGTLDKRRSAIAKLVSQGDFMDVDDEDIEGCTVLMRKDGHQYTVYLLGDNSAATRFPLAIDVPRNGLISYDAVQNEMIRILNDVITPGLR